MSFIEIDDYMINVDQIVKIRRRWDEKNPAVSKASITYKDGTVDQFNVCEGEEIDEKIAAAIAPIVPANPGFYTIWFWFRDYGEPVVADILAPHQREPVIAWHISPDGVTPVTLNDMPFHPAGMKALLRPDGLVVDYPNEDTWKDVDAWAEEVWEKWMQWLEQRKQRKNDTARQMGERELEKLDEEN